MRNFILFSLLLFVFVRCSKDNSPTKPEEIMPDSITGTWSTNGILEVGTYETGEIRGVYMELVFSEDEYNMTSTEYSKYYDDWLAGFGAISSGSYDTNNNYIILYNSYGTADESSCWHYSITGDFLIMNNTSQYGGIFTGSTNKLIGTAWEAEYSYYDNFIMYDNTIKYYTKQYKFITNDSGQFIDYDIYTSTPDTLDFVYTKNNSKLTLTFAENTYSPYEFLYEINQNTLYMYNSASTEFIFHKEE